MLSKEEFSFFGVTITFNSGTTISVKWATLGGIIKMLQRPGCKKKRGTVCHTLYLKVVGNHRCRCNNSSPRYMRENHYAILASN